MIPKEVLFLLAGWLVQLIPFVWYISSRLTRMEMKIDTLTSAEGHNLVARVRELELGRGRLKVER